MTSLCSDADRTSVGWVSPDNVERILADSWKSRNQEKRRRYLSDAEVTSSAFKDQNRFLPMVIAVVGLVFLLLASNRRREKQADDLRAAEGHPALKRIRAEVDRIADGDLRSRAEAVLANLVDAFAGVDLDALPAPSISLTEGGTLLLEWTRGLVRVGINVEPLAVDSGWYFVSLKPGAQGSMSGTIQDLDSKALFTRFLTA